MSTFTHRNRTGRRVVFGVLSALTLTAALAATADARSGADAPGEDRTIVDSRIGDTPTTDDGTHTASREYLGRIAGAYVAPNELALDEMELIEGDTEDGAYTWRDVPGRNRTFPVAADAVVTRVSCGAGGCREGIAGDYDRLTLDVAEESSTNAFRVTVRDGVVVAIDEVYLA